ncbi:hypothetical protein GC105_03275 [Alkalibaculum sp. M08DMB]|uniref:Pilus assembly protein PilZ n=1 Tax=Alkalibaculum sporogenes TaxID=2655001 RepID=A0A6A7K602_9FIRM|nr:PilZ domain-containing protein [Alkalibaculum sporogenes]MPW24812.1 hypothetical protein [Alkalibaculum sporogenes]
MSLFDLNSKIELITKDEKKTAGLIQDIVDNKIYVTIPSDNKELIILHLGEQLKGFVYEKQKLIAFDAIITDRINADIPTYELSSLTNFIALQRREDVRIPCSIPVYYTKNEFLYSISDVEKNIDNIWKYVDRGVVSDLSAGGLRFSCVEDSSVGQNMLLLFELDSVTIIVKGSIVYKELNVATNKTTYIYGVKFQDISESKREQIINHIFVLMRKNRLK